MPKRKHSSNGSSHEESNCDSDDGNNGVNAREDDINSSGGDTNGSVGDSSDDNSDDTDSSDGSSKDDSDGDGNGNTGGGGNGGDGVSDWLFRASAMPDLRFKRMSAYQNDRFINAESMSREAFYSMRSYQAEREIDKRLELRRKRSEEPQVPQLPEEVWGRIVSFSSLPALVTCRQVNRLFHRIFQRELFHRIDHPRDYDSYWGVNDADSDQAKVSSFRYRFDLDDNVRDYTLELRCCLDGEGYNHDDIVNAALDLRCNPDLRYDDIDGVEYEYDKSTAEYNLRRHSHVEFTYFNQHNPADNIDWYVSIDRNSHQPNSQCDFYKLYQTVFENWLNVSYYFDHPICGKEESFEENLQVLHAFKYCVAYLLLLSRGPDAAPMLNRAVRYAYHFKDDINVNGKDASFQFNIEVPVDNVPALASLGKREERSETVSRCIELFFSRKYSSR